MIVAYAEAVCINIWDGKWAYLSSGAATWTLFDDASDTYPSDMQGASRGYNLQCNAGWVNMICINKVNGALAWTGSKPWNYSVPNNYPSDFVDYSNNGNTICGLFYPNVVCISLST